MHQLADFHGESVVVLITQERILHLNFVIGPVFCRGESNALLMPLLLTLNTFVIFCVKIGIRK